MSNICSDPNRVRLQCWKYWIKTAGVKVREGIYSLEKLANESVCELAFRVYVLPREYLLSLKEASSEPYTVSSALICRCTCLWWAGLGLCSCWTCSPERAEQGKEKASACLFIFYFLWRALHASCRIFWVISFQKQVFLVKQQRSNTQENIKKTVVGLWVGGCFSSLYQRLRNFKYN